MKRGSKNSTKTDTHPSSSSTRSASTSPHCCTNNRSITCLKIQLLEHGAHLLDYEQLNERQRLWVDNYFQTAIFPVLTLAVDPAHPFPFVSNLSLNVAALIHDPKAVNVSSPVKVPQKILPRFVTIPADLASGDCEPLHTAVPLEQVVAFNHELALPLACPSKDTISSRSPAMRTWN